MARKRWPQLRGLRVALHVVAVLLLSLPPANKLGDRRRWDRPRTQQEFELWAKRLSSLGLPTTRAELDARLWRLSQGYLRVRGRVATPFEPYGYYLGPSQGWGMFKSPQREPSKLRVEVREVAGWRVVHESRSAQHRYKRTQLDQHRMRKLVGRLASRPLVFDDMARWLARECARDFPAASHVRVRVMRFRSLAPERVRAGERPKLHVARDKTFDLRAVRAGAAP